MVSKDREVAESGSLTTAAGWRRQLRARRIAAALGIALAAWLVLAYGILPLVWTEIERGRHPALEGLPKVTHTAAGIPG